MKNAKKIITLFFMVYLSLIMICFGKEDHLIHNVDIKSISPVSGTDISLPLDLLRIIKTIQREFVQDSYGLESGECFTDEDGAKLKKENKIHEIVNRLRKDNDFLAIVRSIRELRPNERQNLLDSARTTYRKPWSVLRLNPNTAGREELLKGQTKAGSKAERDIANAVVDLVGSIINQ